MEKLSLKEKIFYGLILNEKRVYKHWYSRFLMSGVELDRMRRVVSKPSMSGIWQSMKTMS